MRKRRACRTVWPSRFLNEGYSASDARQAYARAKELSEHIGDRRQLFVALSGLAGFFRNASDMKKALEVAQELLRMASDPGAACAAGGTQRSGPYAPWARRLPHFSGACGPRAEGVRLA